MNLINKNTVLFFVIIPIIFIVISITIGYLQYPNLPNPLPIHYNIQGIADNFSTKNYLWIFFIPAIQLAFNIFISCILIYKNNTKNLLKIMFSIIINLIFLSINLGFLEILTLNECNFLIVILVIGLLSNGIFQKL